MEKWGTHPVAGLEGVGDYEQLRGAELGVAPLQIQVQGQVSMLRGR